MAGTIPFDLVLVRWRDATHPSGSWEKLSRLDKNLAEIVTCGLLVHSDKLALIVAASVSIEPDPFVAAEVTIPRSGVRSMRTLVKASK